jgi:protein arginine N-methyltransferase 7
MASPASPKAILDALAAKARSNPVVQAHLARSLAYEGYRDSAYELARKASALAPENAEVRRVTTEVYGLCVDDWHFPIVHDEARNIAYERAIRNAVRPGMRVLEIGTGTGLFAMMAARAGASEVITCEVNVPVADAAKDIIAKNGLADRVRVIAKRSTDLDAVTDLGGPADLLICEIMTIHLLNERNSYVIKHAVENLLKPGAAIIPAKATARVALVEDVDQHFRRVNTVAGFDLSPFNRLAAPYYLVGWMGRPLILRSAPADLMTHIFRPGKDPRPTQARTSLQSDGGIVNGIAEWVALDLDDDVRYENHPRTPAARCFRQAIYSWAEQQNVPAGQTVTVYCRTNGSRLDVWAD